MQEAFTRFEIAIKQWRSAEALHLYDSLRTTHLVLGMGPNGPVTTGNLVSLVAPVFGRMVVYDSLISATMRQMGLAGTTRERLSHEGIRLLVGAPTDSLLAAERESLAEAAPRGTAASTRAVFFTVAYGLRVPRPSWPPLDTANTDPRLRPAIALMRNDTTALRVAARRLDSLSSLYQAALVADTAITLVAADAYLLLRDSTRALQMTRRWLDSSLAPIALSLGATGQTFTQPIIPRMMLMRADLAAALGYKDEAKLWYTRFLDFWSKAEPEFEPLVQRVRMALERVKSEK
jgi:hypothetical protein